MGDLEIPSTRRSQLDSHIVSILPKFRGDPQEDPRLHVESMRSFLHAMEIPDGLHAAYFRLSLAGPAAGWQLTLTPRQSADFATIAQLFLMRFEPPSNRDSVMAELALFKQQPSESIRQFNQRFHAYMRKCEDKGVDTGNMHVVHAYVGALLPDLKRRVRRKAPDSVQHAMLLAEEQEERYLLDTADDGVATTYQISPTTAPLSQVQVLETCVQTMTKMMAEMMSQFSEHQNQLLDRIQQAAPQVTPTPVNAIGRDGDRDNSQRYRPRGRGRGQPPQFLPAVPPPAYATVPPPTLPDDEKPWCEYCGRDNHTVDQCFMKLRVLQMKQARQERLVAERSQVSSSLPLAPSSAPLPPPPATQVFAPVSSTHGSDRASTSHSPDPAGVHHVSVSTTSSLDPGWRPHIPADNRGYQILQRQGWQVGQGLGKYNQGICEPVAPVDHLEPDMVPCLGARPQVRDKSRLSDACPVSFVRSPLLLAEEEVSLVDSTPEEIVVGATLRPRRSQEVQQIPASVPFQAHSLGPASTSSTCLPSSVTTTTTPYSLASDLARLQPSISLAQLLMLAPKLLDELTPYGSDRAIICQQLQDAGIQIVDHLLHDPGPFICTASVNGKNVPNTIIDSGSGANILPEHVRSRLQLPLAARTSVILKTFAQHQVRPAGVVPRAKIVIDGVHLVLDLLVVDFPEGWTASSSSYNLLLGREWLLGVAATTNWSTGTMDISDGSQQARLYNAAGRHRLHLPQPPDLVTESAIPTTQPVAATPVQTVDSDDHHILVANLFVDESRMHEDERLRTWLTVDNTDVFTRTLETVNFFVQPSSHTTPADTTVGTAPSAEMQPGAPTTLDGLFDESWGKHAAGSNALALLFTDTDSVEAVVAEAVLFTDGAFSKMLDKAGLGAVLLDSTGEVIFQASMTSAANSCNEAEYRALLFGIKRATGLGYRKLELRVDSQLLARQLSGEYKVNSSRLGQLRTELLQLLSSLDHWHVLSIPRESNQLADSLAKQGLWSAVSNDALCEADLSELERSSLVDLVVLDVFSCAISTDQMDLDLSDDPASPKLISVGADISSDLSQQAYTMFREFRDVFAWSYDDLQGVDPDVAVHRILLKSDAIPVQQPQRRLSPQLHAPVNDEVQQLLAAGFIFPVEVSHWISSIVPVRKANGSLRVCVDYRDLNRATVRDYFPTPFIDSILDAVAGFERYSFMDGFSGYNQIPIEPADRILTAFRTPMGIYAYNVLPFGLVNAPATFQRLMTFVFRDLLLHSLRIYMDDFAVASSTQAHLQILSEIFIRCRKYRVQLNPKKCRFFVADGRLLGHLVSKRGVEVYRPKLEQILHSPPPATISHLRRFLGGTGFFRRFVFGYASLTRPLYRLLRVGVAFEWSTDCQLAYERLLDALLASSAVTPPDFSKQFHLFVSVFDETVAVALCQRREDGAFVVVYFLSRMLAPGELLKSVFDQYCAGIVYAFHKLRHYLTEASVRAPTVVHSLINPITYLLARPVLHGQHAHWAFQLQAFDFVVQVHKAAILHPTFLAPLFAHHCSLPAPDTAMDPVAVSFVAVHRPWYSDILAILSGQPCTHLSPAQRRRLFQRAFNYVLIEGTLFRRHEDGMLLRCVDEPDAAQILSRMHECHGHFAAQLTAQRIMRAGYYWPRLFRDAAVFVQRCLPCQKFQPVRIAGQQPLTPILPEGPFSRWVIDFIGPFTVARNRHAYILAATDPCTKWIEAISASAADQETTARFIHDVLCCRFGVPRVLLSDRGSHFMGQVINSLLLKLGVHHVKSSSYWPRGNGQAESSNKILKTILQKLVDENPGTWPQHLPGILWSMRTTCKVVTGFSPFRLVYGVEAILPIQLLYPAFRTLLERCTPADHDTAAQLQSLRSRADQLAQLEDDRDVADGRQRVAKLKLALTDNRQLGGRFVPGDLVWKLDAATRHTPKLQSKWLGPFQVTALAGTNSYTLSDLQGNELSNPVNAAHLKRYYI